MIAWWWLIVAFVGGVSLTAWLIITNPIFMWILSVYWLAHFVIPKEKDASDEKVGNVED